MTSQTLAAAVDVDTLKKAVSGTIDSWEDRLRQVSRIIHDNPELAFEERLAAETLASIAEEAGFAVERSAYGMETCFEAVRGSGDFTVVICAEYDALPEIGHACGHNIIATAALGTGLALGEVADELGLRVVLLGTPAEEHGGGKALLLEAGAWEQATVSMMVHGAAGNEDFSCAITHSQAVDRFAVTFNGRAAHAAAAPHKAINAGDAATISQIAIGLLRQQLPDGVRLNAFVEHGGDVTNVIPARTVVSAEVRAHDLETLEDIKERMLNCFAGGALASGCTWEVAPTEPRYENLVQNTLLAEAWDRNLKALGRTIVEVSGLGGGSTDMGNVSHAVPSIHPMISVLGASGVPHTIEFATDAGSPAGEQAALDGALGMAWTTIDMVTNPETREALLALQAARRPGATRSPALG
ncbi:M20 family metallopeptidase [Arthrobacter sp. CJ23]|uniref:M20 family metallopeptidase n=1 Tax=Arthrobacter sp. CJ23 TaxID=2972479 RepID=UPI00215C79AC|nr:M20 family metallopeptidase [Arthrobacter sp. CJ23]UVJ39879.1 M20 family metallopeptidase [Arthrobacter sp. CJ23]